MLDASASTHLSLSLSLFCWGSRGDLAAGPSRQAPSRGGVGRACLEWSFPVVVERRVASVSVFSAEQRSLCGVEWSGKSGCHRSRTSRAVASRGITSHVLLACDASNVQYPKSRCGRVPNAGLHRRLTHVVPERRGKASPNGVLRRPLPVVPVIPVVSGGTRGSYVQRRGSDVYSSGSRRVFACAQGGPHR
jgi:hypothetical protein